MLQALTTYGSRSLVYLRSRLSLANLICSQATRQHSFVALYSLLSRSFSVDFLHPFLYCPVLFPRILSESAEPVRKGNHYYANLCEKSKLLLIPRASPFQLRFFSIVPFLLADYIRISNVHLLHIYLLRNKCKKQWAHHQVSQLFGGLFQVDKRTLMPKSLIIVLFWAIFLCHFRISSYFCLGQNTPCSYSLTNICMTTKSHSAHANNDVGTFCY